VIPHAGKLYFVLIVSVLLSCVAAWIIAHRYRRRMQQLMRTPGPEATRLLNAPAAEAMADCPAGATVSLVDNRAADMRLTMLLIASSFLLAGTSACIFSARMFPADPLMLWRVIPIAVLHLWPIIPAMALMWRWSRARFFGALLLWWVATWVALFVIGLWRQIDMGPLLVLQIMASEIGLPVAMLSLVFFLGDATRAIAPWLLMPAALLVSSLLAGLDVLTYMAEHESPLLKLLIVPLEGLPGWSGVVVVFGLFLLLAGIIAWWPVRMLGRALGRAYSHKWFSDLLAMYTAVWAFSLTDKALTVANQEAGAGAFAMYLPLLWIPMVIWPAAGWRPRIERPPTLLVLRVFQQDAQAQSLFDHVVERWRLSGNTVMIAGTDLADRTLDAGDIFQFLDAKLAQRFITSPADVARRIDAFDMAADSDGRYRVNECYCHDTTWQDALQALVRYSDIVLMDLRGFQAHNAGCRYELATLASASRELRVVVLTDSRTDRATAQEAIASGRQERFTWIEASHLTTRVHREVLVHLFA